MNQIPRIAAIHDLSGFGRCSLTVIIPVLSSMELQVCPIPTAVLSTHTGGFSGFSFRDLTEDLDAYARHWRELSLQFDCIYTGYLGSVKQVDIVKNILKMFRTESRQLIVVDPVMGDDGQLYSTFTTELQHRMQELVAEADIITPNLTEACFLLNKPYPADALYVAQITEYLSALAKLGPDKVIITSVNSVEYGPCNAGYDSSQGECFVVPYSPVPANYPGTGDLFASVLTGCLLQGASLTQAVVKASDFVADASAETYRYRTPERDGVMLEKLLYKLRDPPRMGGFLPIC